MVYGDTDSVFVLLEGRSKEEAFRIGEEIAQHITALSPKDVLLKFEKVYMPCILATKKRYVGNAYESRGQKEPLFDAKVRNITSAIVENNPLFNFFFLHVF